MSVQPKKSLGQNFLQDETALGKIVAAAELSSSDNVLEIGPGTGVLTKHLVAVAGKVIAVEKDEHLVELLVAMGEKQEPGDKGKSVIIKGDILTINLPQLIEQHDFQDYKVVANIPYYITGQIIRLLLETKYPPKMMVLLVQKEVAERICAQPGDMSILAVSVQYYGRPKYIATVPRESFDPTPEVDSAIIQFKRTRAYSSEDKKFFQLVKIGFSSRRKTLLNNLASGMKKNKQEVVELLRKAGLNEQVRAQELGIDEWLRLAEMMPA